MLLDKIDTYEVLHSENTAATAAATSQPITSYSTDTVMSSRPSHSAVGGACHTGSDVITEVDSISERISVADLLIMQSSFDSKYISIRSCFLLAQELTTPVKTEFYFRSGIYQVYITIRYAAFTSQSIY